MRIVVDGMNRKGLAESWKDLGYKYGCEIGVQNGRFSKLIFETIPDITMYLVDPYERYKGSPYKHGLQRAEKNAHTILDGNNAKWIKGRSEDVHVMFDDESLDFIYIDGNHGYDWVMTDIILWSRKVRKGGMVSGHDYDVRIRGVKPVKQAVHDYINGHNIDPFYITDRHARKYRGDRYASFFWFVE